MPPYAGLSSVFELTRSDHGEKSTVQPALAKQAVASYDYKLKHAQTGALGSLQAVLDFLSHHGVAKASIQELQQGLDVNTVVTTMERAQDYAECVSASPSTRLVECRALVCLLTSAWESVGRFTAVLHWQAYKTVQRLRQEAAAGSTSWDRALQVQISRAEECCAAQKGLILVQEWGRQLLLVKEQRGQ